jgi:hypothetical protein
MGSVCTPFNYLRSSATSLHPQFKDGTLTAPGPRKLKRILFYEYTIMAFNSLFKHKDPKKSDDSGGQPDATRSPERHIESPTQTPVVPPSGRSAVVLCNPRIIAITENVSTVHLCKKAGFDYWK